MFLGKVILITGASSGIGAATAIHFAKVDAKLALTGRNMNNLEEVAKKCEAESKVRPLTVIGDLDKDSDVKNILDRTIETYGKLDVLINNAGIFEVGDIENTNIQQYDRIFSTNLRSIYLLTSLAVPHLIQTRGNIVNISSVAAMRPYSHYLAYSMSKAALNHFTRCVAFGLAPKQVRVNSINPGIVDTKVLRRAGISEEMVKKRLENCKKSHPLGRAAKLEEVLEAIAFLASDRAGFTTGETLTLDGGLSLFTNPVM